MWVKKIKNCSIVFLLFTAASCGGKSAQQQQQAMQAPPAVPVTVQQVTAGDAVYYDEYPASVTALNQVELRPQVSGYITGIYFKDGARIEKGQKLYSIDQQQYQANYQQAVANLEVQKTNLVKAQKDADRYHELEKQDAIAKQQVDYADAALEAAKRQVEAAQANVHGVQTSVRYSTIYAPYFYTCVWHRCVSLSRKNLFCRSCSESANRNNHSAFTFSKQQRHVETWNDRHYTCEK